MHENERELIIRTKPRCVNQLQNIYISSTFTPFLSLSAIYLWIVSFSHTDSGQISKYLFPHRQGRFFP